MNLESKRPRREICFPLFAGGLTILSIVGLSAYYSGFLESWVNSLNQLLNPQPVATQSAPVGPVYLGNVDVVNSSSVLRSPLDVDPAHCADYETIVEGRKAITTIIVEANVAQEVQCAFAQEFSTPDGAINVSMPIFADHPIGGRTKYPLDLEPGCYDVELGSGNTVDMDDDLYFLSPEGQIIAQVSPPTAAMSFSISESVNTLALSYQADGINPDPRILFDQVHLSIQPVSCEDQK